MVVVAVWGSIVVVVAVGVEIEVVVLVVAVVVVDVGVGVVVGAVSREEENRKVRSAWTDNRSVSRSVPGLWSLSGSGSWSRWGSRWGSRSGSRSGSRLWSDSESESIPRPGKRRIEK